MGLPSLPGKHEICISLPVVLHDYKLFFSCTSRGLTLRGFEKSGKSILYRLVVINQNSCWKSLKRKSSIRIYYDTIFETSLLAHLQPNLALYLENVSYCIPQIHTIISCKRVNLWWFQCVVMTGCWKCRLRNHQLKVLFCKPNIRFALF